jgi:hypothetical protein
LNKTEQFAAHADDVNSVGKKVLIINTKTKEISICSKEADLVHIQALSPEQRTKS